MGSTDECWLTLMLPWYVRSPHLLIGDRPAELLNHSLALTATSGLAKVAAAAPRTTALRSFTLVAINRSFELPNPQGEAFIHHVLNMTLSPSFHISGTRVSPGYTTPTNLGTRQPNLSGALHEGCMYHLQRHSPHFDVLELTVSL